MASKMTRAALLVIAVMLMVSAANAQQLVRASQKNLVFKLMPADTAEWSIRQTALRINPVWIKDGKECKPTHAQVIHYIRANLWFKTRYEYDKWANSVRFDHDYLDRQYHRKSKLIEILVVVNGDKSEYTFEEFKKILWP